MNLKRIILGSALAVATATSLSLNISAAEPVKYLKQDFTHNAGDTLGNSGKDNIYNVYSVNKDDVNTYELIKHEGEDALFMASNANYTGFLKTEFRKNGTVNNQLDKSIIINTRIMIGNDPQARTIGVYGNSCKTQMITLQGLTPNVWHEVKVVLVNEKVDAGAPTKDHFDLYIDNEYKSTSPLKAEFDGKLSAVFIQAGWSDSVHNVESKTWIDYYNVEEYVSTEAAATNLSQEEIKSSFKIQYTEGQEDQANVDLRIGGSIKNESYDENAEYGIIILDNKDAAKLDNLTPAGLAELKTQKLSHAIKPVKVDLGYQFAWVIPNIEGHYDFEFRPAFYMLKDGVLTLSKHDNIVSAADTARKYLNDEAIKANKSLAVIMNMISANKQVEE